MAQRCLSSVGAKSEDLLDARALQLDAAPNGTGRNFASREL
jgi:hypothetical protein